MKVRGTMKSDNVVGGDPRGRRRRKGPFELFFSPAPNPHDSWKTVIFKSAMADEDIRAGSDQERVIFLAAFPETSRDSSSFDSSSPLLSFAQLLRLFLPVRLKIKIQELHKMDREM